MQIQNKIVRDKVKDDLEHYSDDVSKEEKEDFEKNSE